MSFLFSGQGFNNCDGLKILVRCFMERQVLADFVHILKISEDSKIEAPLLQYLSIMIQNMDSEHAICKMAILVF